MNCDGMGYRWLAETYGVEAAQPFPVSSLIGKSRATSHLDGLRTETYPERYRPNSTLAGRRLR